jgi:hypothetical protein
MDGCVRGCVGRSVLLGMLLIVFGGAAFWWATSSDRVSAAAARARLSAEPPSEALATRAEGKLESIRSGGGQDVALSGPEIESLLLYRFEDRWPRGVSSPSVHFQDGELHLGLQISRDLLPALPDLEGLLVFLPDTVPIQLQGRVLALGDGGAALMVERMDASSIPIPRRLFALLLAQVQGPNGPGVPADAFILPLPQEVRSLRIEGSDLILTPAS